MVNTRTASDSPLVELDSSSTERKPEALSQDRVTPEHDSQLTEPQKNGGKESESDGEERERPVRKQLEKTTINRTEGDHEDADETTHSDKGKSATADHGTEQSREPSPERESRKRSFDEVREGASVASEQTSFKQQRQTASLEKPSDPVSQSIKPASEISDEKKSPSTPPPTAEADQEALAESQLSPQNKRNRDTFLASQDVASLGALKEVETSNHTEPNVADEKHTGTDEEPTRKKTRDSPPLKITNTDDTNEASSGDQKSYKAEEVPPTSPTKFAASGFAGFTGAASPFGNIGGSAQAASPFATFGASKPTETSSKATPSSGFAGISGGFGSLSGQKSGFGSLGASSFGGVLASASPFASSGTAPLTSFASGKGDFGAAAKKPVKPIGSKAEAEEGDASAADEEDEENPESETTPVPDSDEHDERFYEQDVETGEENEATLFTSRAKLYMIVEKQWKERGHGVFKVNAHHEDGSIFRNNPSTGGDKKVVARFLMRADGSHRLALNSPIKKELQVQDPSGGPPKGNTAVFLGWVDEKPTLLQLKLRNNVQVEEFHGVVTRLQQRM